MSKELIMDTLQFNITLTKGWVRNESSDAWEDRWLFLEDGKILLERNTGRFVALAYLNHGDVIKKEDLLDRDTYEWKIATLADPTLVDSNCKN